MKYDINTLLAKANEDDVPSISASAGSSGYSFSVVYSKSNSKRLSFSKALVEKLQLEDVVYLVPVPSEKVLLIAKELHHKRVSNGKLSGEESGKKICYHANLAKLMVDSFELDYTGGKTSYSFGRIDFMDNDGVTVAVVDMTTAKAAATANQKDGESA